MYYYSVVLKVDGHNVVMVPSTWIIGLDEEDLLNNGIDLLKQYIVFYSSNLADQSECVNAKKVLLLWIH